MKKFVFIPIFIVSLICGILICGCADPAPSESEGQYFTVTYIASENGSISGTANQSVKEGEDGTEVIAVANDGYKFVKWSDGIETPERQDKNVTKNISVTAIFEKLSYTLNYVAGEGGYLLGNENQTVNYGENGTKVTAIPNDGYKFVKWSDGETKDTRQDTEINTAISVTAVFEFLFAGGEGTQLNPYKIESYTQLLNMRYYPDKAYSLSCDLDLNGINHAPIFDANEYFEGMFFGNDKTIKNLTVETESNFPSLFGMVMGGLVDNLTLKNVNITTTDFNTIEAGMQYYVGALAGYFAGRIDNVSVSGKITANGLSYDGVAIGGLVGVDEGYVSNCNINIQIWLFDVENKSGKEETFFIGGMLGVANSINIQNCSAAGKIKAKESCTGILAGGLVGYFLINDNSSIVSGCETNIEIINVTYAGGFIGRAYGAENTIILLLNNTVYGDVNAKVAVGYIYSLSALGDFQISDCKVESNINGSSRAVGFIYSCISNEDEPVIIKNCFVDGTISDRSEKGIAVGLCFQVSNAGFYRCYFNGNVEASCAVSMFVQLSHCTIVECYSLGNSIGKFQSATILTATYSYFIDCYSQSNVYLTNEEENINARTLAAGFVVFLTNSKMDNCYYGGQIFGHVYAAGPLTDGCIVGGFIGSITNSIISNCHFLYPSDSFATDVIVRNYNDETVLTEIIVYSNIEEMYFLADTLNEGQDEEIWVNIQNDLPKLKFEIAN